MAAYSELALLDNKPQQLSVRRNTAIEGEREVKGKNNGWLSEKRQHWTTMNDRYEGKMYHCNDLNESNNKT